MGTRRSAPIHPRTTSRTVVAFTSPSSITLSPSVNGNFTLAHLHAKPNSPTAVCPGGGFEPSWSHGSVSCEMLVSSQDKGDYRLKSALLWQLSNITQEPNYLGQFHHTTSSRYSVSLKICKKLNRTLYLFGLHSLKGLRGYMSRNIAEVDEVNIGGPQTHQF